MKWDAIVVGAGSGGGVVASRLSEDAKRSVLLLEAGPDFPDAIPESVLHLSLGSGVPEYDWNYSDLTISSGAPRGRLVGGSSAVNATYALRGQPQDYDGWRDLGLRGWGWEEVLPHFNRIEDDADFGDRAYHGRGGPVHVRRDFDLTPAEEAFMAAWQELGSERVDDLNQPGAVGVGPLSRNVRDGVRQSVLVTYIAAARARPNLSIRSGTHVDRVLFEEERAIGVRTAGGEVLHAGTVVLAAGAYNTPLILMRSGIGDREALARVGITCRLHHPGVGENLLDHPLTMIAVNMPQAAPRGPHLRMGPTAKLRTQRHLPVDDVKVTLIPGDMFNMAGLTGFLLEVDVVQSRGALTMTSAHPEAAPVIEHRLLSHAEDLERAVRGVQLAVAAQEVVAGGLECELLLPDRATARDPQLLRDYLRTYHGTGYHPAGTCRMGTDADDDAVTDERCRVRGLEGLWVADASVMPTLPRANTNFPVMMIGERVADFIARA